MKITVTVTLTDNKGRLIASWDVTKTVNKSEGNSKLEEMELFT